MSATPAVTTPVTITIDGNPTTVTAGPRVPGPYIIASSTITEGQAFVVVKSACLDTCSDLGTQMSSLTYVGGAITIIGTPFQPTATIPVPPSYNLVYTYGDRTAGYTSNGASTFITFDSTTNIGTTTIALNAGGIHVNGVQSLPISTAGTDSVSDASTSAQTTAPAPTGQQSTRPSATIATTTSPAESSKSSGVSAGGAAGIGIGCALAGALLGSLVAFLLLRRGRKRSRSQIGLVEMVPKEKHSYADVKQANNGLAAIVTSNLPQAAEDKHIEREFGTLCQRIRDHVDSYYDCSTPKAVASVPDLELLGHGIGTSPSELASLLSSPSTRASTLCLCIAWTIIIRLDVSCDPQTSFLPPHITAILPHLRSTTNSSDRVQTTHFSLWRTLTASLIHPSPSRSNSLSVTTSTPTTQFSISAIQAAYAALDPFLAPFSTTPPAAVTSRILNLEEILKRGARFGWTLFVQPGVWEFRWRGARGAEGRSLVVFPGLVQTVGDEGERLERERVLVRAESVRI